MSAPTPERKAIIADDEPGLLFVIAHVLRQMGFTVWTATDGAQAVDAFTAERPVDLILLDMTMPVKDGATAMRDIRAIDPAAPVMLMSAYHKDDVLQDLGNPPGLRFLQKPFSPQHLRDSVNAFFNTI